MGMCVVANAGVPSGLFGLQGHVFNFNELPSFEEATSKFDQLPRGKWQDFLTDASGVLSATNLTDVIGVGIKHRHFDMPENHILVAEQFADRSEMSPKAQTHAFGALPISFGMHKGGLHAYEYVYPSKNVSKKMDMLSAGLFENLVSLSEFHGLADLASFHIKVHDNLMGESGCANTLEQSGLGDRELVITARQPGDEDDARQVMWHTSSPKKHDCKACCKGHTHVCKVVYQWQDGVLVEKH